MCGIVGLLAAADGPPPDRGRLERAVEALRHRGPDGRGIHVDGRVALGHTRLSIIDVEGGAQPLGNEDGSVVTVFNGEIWNHLELRRTLETSGHRFRTHCDTEVIVHGYEQWGADVVRHLDGMFAFAVWDAEHERLLLARDPVGKKPLYVHESAAGVAFGSDARTALMVAGSAPSPDLEGIASVLFQRYAVSPRTPFAGVERLRAGHLLVYDRHGPSKQQAYWELKPPRDPAPLERDDLRELLRTAVAERLMSDVPLGVLLSGGVDSAAVLALAREATPGPLDTFTIGFADAIFDERPLARVAADRARSTHHELVVDGDMFLSAFTRLAWYRDEPIAEPSEVPLLLLAEFASQHVKVTLGGDGGDELFGGYPKYRADRVIRRLGPAAGVMRALALPLRWRTATHRRIARAVETLDVRSETLRWASWFRTFSPQELAALVAPELTDLARPERLVAPLAERLRDVAELDPARRMLVGDFHTYLQDNMLLRTDKVLMAASLEGRVPLLDRELVERVSATPAYDRFGWMTGKRLLRDSVADIVPDEILRAPKRGFPVPVARLLAEGDGHRLKRMLVSERTLSRGLLRPEAVRGTVSQEAGTSVDQELKVFTLASLELWFRACVDATFTSPPSLDQLLDDVAA